jgi:hypothetical protein
VSFAHSPGFILPGFKVRYRSMLSTSRLGISQFLAFSAFALPRACWNSVGHFFSLFGHVAASGSGFVK